MLLLRVQGVQRNKLEEKLAWNRGRIIIIDFQWGEHVGQAHKAGSLLDGGVDSRHEDLVILLNFHSIYYYQTK